MKFRVLHKLRSYTGMLYLADPLSYFEVPLQGSRISAGFPSPADDYVDRPIDLNTYLVHKPAATFIMRVKGDSMIDAGIYPHSLIVVDRSIKPFHNAIVVAAVDGEYTVKRLYYKDGTTKLVAANPHYPDIKIQNELIIFGVVTSTILSFRDEL